MSWIALEDVIGILKLCLERTPIQGAVQFAPISGPAECGVATAVTNAEFTKELARALHRRRFYRRRRLRCGLRWA